MAYLGYIGVGKEAYPGSGSYGTLVSRTEFLRYTAAEIRERMGEIFLRESTSRFDHDVILGPYDCEADFTVESRPDKIGLILLGLTGLNTPANLGGSPVAYRHDMKPATQPSEVKFLSLEQRFGTYGGEVKAVTGLAMRELQFLWERQTLRLKGVGFGKMASAVAPSGSPTFSSVLPFAYHELTASFAGVTRNVRSGRVTVRNRWDEEDYGSSRFRLGADPDLAELLFELTVKFDNLDDSKRFWGGTSYTQPQNTAAQYPLILTWTSPTVISGSNYYALVISAPDCQIQEVSEPIPEAKGRILRVIRGKAIYDTGIASLYQISLTNTVSAY